LLTAIGFVSSQTFFHINTPTVFSPVILQTYPPTKMEQTECSEMSAYKIQTPGNYPEVNIQHSEQGESLKSGNVRNFHIFWPQKSPNLSLLLFGAKCHVMSHVKHVTVLPTALPTIKKMHIFYSCVHVIGTANAILHEVNLTPFCLHFKQYLCQKLTVNNNRHKGCEPKQSWSNLR